MDYKFFIDTKMKSSKHSIYKCDKLPIELKLNADNMDRISVETYNICIEKHKSYNLLQIRLSSVHDSSSIFICTIDDVCFEKFKVEQSLFVTFETFVNQITEMMEKCRNKSINILLTVVDKNSPTSLTHQLQIYEKGTFKNLVHISLPIIPAPYEVILFHINQKYSHLQEENRILMQKNMHFQNEISLKHDQIEQLNCVINEMKTTMNDQEIFFKENHKEQFIRLENEIKSVNDAKKHQTTEMHKQISVLQSQIDNLDREKSELCERLKMETAKNFQVISDCKNAHNKIIELNKQLENLNTEWNDQQNAILKNNNVILDIQKQNKNLDKQILVYEKQIHDLMAELQAERNICQIKKNGLKIATEDICNANAIIRKQAAEMDALKKKVNLRTEVALKQENVIKESSKDGNLSNLIEKIDGNMHRILQQNQETKHRIDSIRNQTKAIDNKYKDKIDDLQDRIQMILLSSTK